MKHEVKLKGTMPICTSCFIELMKKDCDGYDYSCSQYRCDEDGFCKNCSYEKEIFQAIQTNSVIFERELERTYYEEQTLKIGRKDYSNCNIEYLEIDGIVLVDKTAKAKNTD